MQNATPPSHKPHPLPVKEEVNHSTSSDQEPTKPKVWRRNIFPSSLFFHFSWRERVLWKKMVGHWQGGYRWRQGAERGKFLWLVTELLFLVSVCVCLFCVCVSCVVCVEVSNWCVVSVILTLLIMITRLMQQESSRLKPPQEASPPPLWVIT